MVKPWLLYLRVSTEEQAEAGASLAMQRDQCAAMAQALGHRDVEVISDDGWSGKDLKRPGMATLLARMKSRAIGGVIVWKIDRLTRSLRDLLHLVDQLDAHQVALVSLHERIDTSGPMGRFVLSIMGAVAQLERETIAQRVGASMRHLRSKGFWTGGRPPPGTKIVGPKGQRQLEVVPKHAAAVRRAFESCVAGAPLTDLAEQLHRSGATDQLRTPANVAAMLRNQLLVELGVVPADLFRRANEAIVTRRPGKVGRVIRQKAPERDWPLQGLVRCARCGGAVVATYATGRNKSYPYLACANRIKKRCKLPHLPAEPWEQQTIAAVQRAVESGDWLKAWSSWAAAQRAQIPLDSADRQRLTDARDRAAAKAKRLLDLVGDDRGTITREQIAEQERIVADCDRQLAAYAGREAGAAVLDQRREFMQVNLIQAAKRLKTASKSEQGAILRGVVSRVIVEAEPPSLVVEMHVPEPVGGSGSCDLSRLVPGTKQGHEPGPRVCYQLALTRDDAGIGLVWAESVAGPLPDSRTLAVRLGVSRRTAQRLICGQASPARLLQARVACAEVPGPTSGNRSFQPDF